MNPRLFKIAFCLLCLAPAAMAEDVPPDVQAKLVFRMLTYDRALPEKTAHAVVTLAVVSKKGNAESEQAASQLGAAFTDLSHRFNVGGQSIRVVALPYSDLKSLDADCQREHVSVVYLGSGLTGDLDDLIHLTRDRALLSISGSRPYVERGVSVGLIADGPRATIVVNLRSVRAEKSDLDSAFLRVVEVLVGRQ